MLANRLQEIAAKNTISSVLVSARPEVELVPHDGSRTVPLKAPVEDVTEGEVETIQLRPTVAPAQDDKKYVEEEEIESMDGVEVSTIIKRRVDN